MHVVKPDAKRTLGILEDRRKAVREQYGLLFVIEALSGGSFAKEVTAAIGLDEQTSIAMKRCEESLKAQRPILVAHNALFDLCFIHQTFFGPLPLSLEDFEQEIHANFPRLADTKYMVERGQHEMEPDYTLENLYLRVKDQTNPRIVAPPGLLGHQGRAHNPHNAGFDSRSVDPYICTPLTQRRLDDGSVICEEDVVASP